MIKKINISSITILFLILLISFSITGCKSFDIPDQQNPSLSLMVLKLNTPNEYEIKEVDIIGDGTTYSRVVRDVIRSKDNRQLQIFTNIPGGKYRIIHLYAETKKVPVDDKTIWNQLNLKFIDTGKRSTKNDQWLELTPGSIKYAGIIDFITIEMKDEVLKRLGEIYKKSPQEVNKAVMSEFEMISEKGKTHGIFIRLDHPALVGHIESLQIEKNVWQVLLDTRRKKPAHQW
ncbi:MAG: hypothetical protein CVV49_12465, partial [Spirochaetae bacterium HGW-Spirochaetae-5]